MASLRRPVAAAGAVMISRGVTVLNVSAEDSVVKLSGASARSPSTSSTASSVGVLVVSATVSLSVSLGGYVGCVRCSRPSDGSAYCATWVISNGVGCCAWCGCAGPAYTLSFDSMVRPRLLCGSMPLMAFSTARSGCLSSRSA